mgnify:CR=1 FL=1
MHKVGSFKRRLWVMDLRDSVRAGHMSLSLSNWRDRTGEPTPLSQDKNRLTTNNLIKLVGGMIAKGMTKWEIQQSFGIDFRNTTRFWKLFLEWPESEQIETFKWADSLGKPKRFRIGDM